MRLILEVELVLPKKIIPSLCVKIFSSFSKGTKPITTRCGKEGYHQPLLRRDIMQFDGVLEKQFLIELFIFDLHCGDAKDTVQSLLKKFFKQIIKMLVLTGIWTDAHCQDGIAEIV